MIMKRVFFAAMLFCALLTSCQEPRVVIAQVSDPQFGFCDAKDITPEVENMTKIVASLNKISPDAVVFTGDLVHRVDSSDQWEAFKRLSAELNDEIKVFNLPGNHDIVINGTSLDQSRYMKELQTDRFCDRIGNVMLLGLNTNYIKYCADDDAEMNEHFEWMKQCLEQKKKGDIPVIFGHHPFYLDNIDEEEGYFQLSEERRKKYFEVFDQNQVAGVFCGHYHRNAETAHGEVPVITTSSMGKQLGDDVAGIRIIIIEDGKVSHKYYPIDEIPSEI